MMFGMILLMMLTNCETNARSFLVETSDAKSFLVETANNTAVPPATTAVPLPVAVPTATAAYHETNARSFIVETTDAISYLVETADKNVRNGKYTLEGLGMVFKNKQT